MTKLGFGKPKSSKQRLIAKNMSVLSGYTKNAPEEDGFIYLDCAGSPFELGGIDAPADNGNEYYRLDASKKGEYSDNNRALAECTPGGTVRFATNASEIALRITLRSPILGMHHFCDRGVYGIDVYCGTGTDRHYLGGQMQTFADHTDVNRGKLALPAGNNEILINLPLYGGIARLEVGFPKGSRIGAPTKRDFAPVAFYGSSITQGGCVSRPANSYCNIICRALNADCRNFGFSGSAMGELPVADFIASHELSCFVMDYDYNSPSIEHLTSTHEPFYKRIREHSPELPIIFVTHPFYAEAAKADLDRISVVRRTYENAVAAGDKKVWFIDSGAFFTPEMRDLYAVDNLHPNDLGQMSMAQTIFPYVKEALGIK